MHLLSPWEVCRCLRPTEADDALAFSYWDSAASLSISARCPPIVLRCWQVQNTPQEG